MLAILALATAITLLVSLKLLSYKSDKVVALVNGQKIYKSQITQRLQEVFQNSDSSELNMEKLPKEVLEILAKDIFIQDQLDKRARRFRIIKSKETKKKVDEYTRKLTRKEYLDSVIKEKITDEAVKEKYVELVSELSGKKEIRLRHILLQSENQARNIFNKIRAGQSFENLAAKYSIDKATADKGGDLGYVIEGGLTSEFADVVESMKIGEVSDPIQTEYGWHLVKVEDIKDAEIAPFESIKDAVKEEMQSQEIKNIFADISNDAKIEILISLPKDQKEEIPDNKPEPITDDTQPVEVKHPDAQ